MGRSTDKETRLSEQGKYRKWTAQQKLEIVPTMNPRLLDFASRRVGNYQYSPQTGTAHLDQLWIR